MMTEKKHGKPCWQRGDKYMASFTKADIQAATGAAVAVSADIDLFCSVETDTRVVRSGALFVALKGERFDGHDFVRNAVQQGAAGIIVSQMRDEYQGLGVSVFLVEDTLKAYQELARFHRRRFSIPVIAVTGSVGKTSTRNMIASVLSQKYKVLQTEKNFNNEIGLPKTLLQLTEQHEACVVEMGMRGLGQIAELAAIAEPTIGVVTNVGNSHIELLGSQENIAKAKSELVSSLPENGTAILNHDDPFVSAMASLCRGSVVTYGTEGKADIWADNIAVSEQGLTFQCHCAGDVFDAHISVIGRHHVYNGLAAAAVGWTTGLKAADIQRGLEAYKGVPMREELLHLDSYTFINDTYNANPASMNAAIHSLKTLTSGRKIAVLGGMLELGNWAKAEHEKIGRVIADSDIDILITMGDLAGYIADAAKECGMKQVYAVETHEECASCLKKLLQPGDTVLVKGSRGFAMEKVLSYFERKSCEC